MVKRAERRPGQPDFVAHGSEQHANLLQIRPATDEDKYVVKGKGGKSWTLMDTTAFGPQATEAYITEVLRQKVSELDAGPPQTQSEDPWAPGYCPPMIVPPEERERVAVTLEQMEAMAS